jgi:hypothetical protein
MLPPSSGRWYPTTTLHGIANQKTSTWNITAAKALKLANFPLLCHHKYFVHLLM